MAINVVPIQNAFLFLSLSPGRLALGCGLAALQAAGFYPRKGSLLRIINNDLGALTGNQCAR